MLLGQRVVNIVDEDLLQIELLGRLVDARGENIPAGAFVPIASQHGLMPSIDTRVVEHALNALHAIPSLPWTLSVNVSMQSIGDAAFRAALKDLLVANKAVSRRLVFELAGFAAGRSPELTRAFAAELHRIGARVAFDNFDIDRSSMAIVQEVLPAYIKLSPAFTQQIGEREDLRFIIEAMVRMLRPLEIPLIAQGVEDEGMIATLAELGLAGYQGYAAGRPEPLPAS
jgi:EAL domain-containing protein (putative c-di-GMP-specific phosphodiesterase class I)